MKTTNKMTPQNITTRYVNALLRSGSNADFKIISMTRKSVVVKDQIVGHYYEMTLQQAQSSMQSVGATPEQALECGLSLFGATFA